MAGMTTNMMAVAGMVVITAAMAGTMAARPLVVIGMAVAMAETVVARPLMKSSITRRWAAAGMAARPHRAV